MEHDRRFVKEKKNTIWPEEREKRAVSTADRPDVFVAQAPVRR